MPAVQLHPKIQERKRQAQPINYNTTLLLRSGDNSQEFNDLLDKRIVRGYGVIWGQRNGWGERFHKGAFSRSIRENGPGSGANYEIKFRDEHGRACSLFGKLLEDDIGLYFESVPLDKVSWCDDLLTQLRSRTVNNFSIGFNYIWDVNAMRYNDEDDTIEIFQARLMEISAVSIPADTETYAVRSVEEAEALTDEIEEFIRTAVPRKDQLHLRKLFSRHKLLSDSLAMQERKRNLSQKETKPVAQGLDYKYLLNHLNID